MSIKSPEQDRCTHARLMDVTPALTQAAGVTVITCADCGKTLRFPLAALPKIEMGAQ